MARVGQALIVLALLFASGLALGQDPPVGPPDPTAVIAPVLTQNTTVAYPERAISEGYFTETTVVVVLELDATGAVTQVTLGAQYGHGFDEAASAAARQLRFQPARRGEVPIAARVGFQFLFRPPSPRLRGTVLSRRERGVAAEVTITQADGTSRNVSAAADGSWETTGLQPGRVRVRAQAGGMQPGEAEADLRFAEEALVVIRLEPQAPVASEPPGEATEDDVVEVEVRGTRPPREVTRRTLSRDEIDQLPGTRGDALRSLQSLPGVARTPPIGGQLVVRGSAPAETIVFVDGTPIPLAYHFGGLSSVLPTEALDRIDFYPGNYGATYGRGTAGMVDVALRNPSVRLHATAQLDLIDARLLVEGPLGGSGWRFLAAARLSWFDVWLIPILESTSAGVSTTPRYYDYQLMLQRDFGTRTSVRTTFFGSHDQLAITRSATSAAEVGAGGGFGAETAFVRLQSVFRHRYSDQGELRAIAAAGMDQIDFGAGSNFVETTEYPLSLRSEVSQRLGGRLRGNLGLDLLYSPYELSLRLPPRIQMGSVPAPGTPQIAATGHGSRGFAGVHLELEAVPWRGARVVPGLRVDYASTTATWDIAPRLNVRQDFGEGPGHSVLKAGIGLYFQPPDALQSDPTYGRAKLRSSRAIHYALGLERQITAHLDLSVEGFAKSLDRLVVAGSGNSGEGRAVGVETMLRYRGDPRFFGWLAYTISRSERRDREEDPWSLFQYDQTHILTAVGSVALGNGYRLGGRFRLVSGNLYTPTVNGGYDASAGSYVGALQAPAYGERLGLFHQLDLRLEKAWTFTSWKLTAYVDTQNIYNHRAVESVSYSFDYSQSSPVEGLTILPSLGLRGEL